MPETLDIHLGDRKIGMLTNLANDRNVFEFDEQFVADPNRPIVSLSFLDEAGNVVRPTSIPQTKLLPFFSNLLPEGHLRSYLAQKAHVNSKRDFPLVWILGEDLPGAIIARHPDGTTAPQADKDVSSAIEAEKNPSILRFSLAGVQLKFSAVLEADGELTIPVRGQNGRWILKMPSPTFRNVPENEYSMMTFAREVGIDVPEIHLADPTSVRNLPPEIRTDLGLAFYIRRFDRDDNRRIHMEDFNQVFGQYPADKYKNVSYGNMLSNIWRVMGEDQAREFVRRLIFNIGIGNADMHLKNWSLIYRDQRTPELSPAYDYLSTVVYIDDDKLGLTLARTREWGEIDEDLLTRFARRSGVPRGVVLQSSREIVHQMREVWPRIRDQFVIPKEMSLKISDHMNSVPLFGARASASGMALPTPSAEETPTEIS
jgi:serine/threonine-protein kinase HipA